MGHTDCACPQERWFRQTLWWLQDHSELQAEQYSLPRIEVIFANLAGGQKFSKIDLRQAYHQIEMEEDSKKYLAINTHMGLFQYNRLVFGITPMIKC